MKINLFKSQLAWLFIICTMGALSSCGGGGGSGSSTTTINGIAVPPEPDATQNNATVAGVDSNSNGVRDDVERKVAGFSKNPEDFQSLLNFAKYTQSIVLSSDNDSSKAKTNTCFGISNPEIADKIFFETINNAEKFEAYFKGKNYDEIPDC